MAVNVQSLVNLAEYRGLPTTMDRVNIPLCVFDVEFISGQMGQHQVLTVVNLASREVERVRTTSKHVMALIETLHTNGQLKEGVMMKFVMQGRGVIVEGCEPPKNFDLAKFLQELDQ